MLFNSITETIGKTPVVRLQNQSENIADIYVKLEFFNPGGSVKDRIALNMIEKMEKDGSLKKGDIIVEPTSGNTGIGIAMIGSAKGYKLILAMPDTMSMERRQLLKAYGAELVLTDGTKGMKGAIEKAKELSEKDGYTMLSQFENCYNVDAHIENTSLEILTDINDLNAFVAGVGTGGTVTGIGKVFKEKNLDIEIIAVEPEDSPVLSGGQPGPHKIQGIGAGFVPPIMNLEYVDSIEKITLDQALEGARLLAKTEGILLGISGGAAFEAALRTAKRLGRGKKVLFIAPDNGERYLSTMLYQD